MSSLLGLLMDASWLIGIRKVPGQIFISNVWEVKRSVNFHFLLVVALALAGVPTAYNKIDD